MKSDSNAANASIVTTACFGSRFCGRATWMKERLLTMTETRATDY